MEFQVQAENKTMASEMGSLGCGHGVLGCLCEGGGHLPKRQPRWPSLHCSLGF